MNDVTGSSLITGEDYYPDRQILHIRYPNNAEYHHENVTPEMYAAFQAAESKGKWLIANIRGNKNHPFTQVTAPTPKAKR